MTDQRCTKCNLVFDESEFKLDFFCKNCWQRNTNDELSRYENAFSWELFQLKYPRPWSVWYKIEETSDRKYLFEVGKKKLEEEIEVGEAAKRRVERIGDTSDDRYKELKADIQQAQEQYARILYYKP